MLLIYKKYCPSGFYYVTNYTHFLLIVLFFIISSLYHFMYFYNYFP